MAFEEEEEVRVLALVGRALGRHQAGGFDFAAELVADAVAADGVEIGVTPAQRAWLAPLGRDATGRFGDARREPAPDLTDDERSSDDGAGGSPGGAWVALPLVGLDGVRLGTMLAWRDEATAFSLAQRSLLRHAARQVGDALQVVLLTARLSAALRRAREAREQHATRAGEQREAVRLLVHDLKNPLQVIALTADSVRRDAPADLRDALVDILQAASIATRLVNDVLDVSESSEAALAFERQPIDLFGLATTLTARLGSLAGLRGHRLEVAGEAGPLIDGDAFLLERLLRNLVDNALKYAPADSTITISVHARGDRVLLDVEDEGPAIDAALRTGIFEGDTRTVSPARGSHGLGLRLCKRVATLHDASISVEPVCEGRGNRFRVEFPRASA